jgi:ADP-ribose pyrophosphatase YjhB (NUDIX family)
MNLPEPLATEMAALSARYGPPALIDAAIPDGNFDPVGRRNRVGEVCMVIRRPTGHLLTCRKTFYPTGIMRLLTGGIEHGETIEAALLREVAEETSLTVEIRHLLAVIAYRASETPPDRDAFYTFAFLLDEVGGELAVQDPEEQVEAFGEATPADLPALAVALERLEEHRDPAIGGSWRSWGVFRAVAHRAVAQALGGV